MMARGKKKEKGGERGRGGGKGRRPRRGVGLLKEGKGRDRRRARGGQGKKWEGKFEKALIVLFYHVKCQAKFFRGINFDCMG